MPAENNTDSTGPGRTEEDGDAAVAGRAVVVRRNAGLAALIGATASAVAIAYLWRASQTMSVLDWGLCAVMACVAALYLATLVDARTPLLVADDLGVRIRLGHDWRGLPWDAIDEVVVRPRRGLLRDGRLVLSPHSLGRALDGLDGRGKRQAARNQKVYGAALAVPLGVTTRVSTVGGRPVAGEIAALAVGRAQVTEVTPEAADGPGEAATDPLPESPALDPAAEPVADVPAIATDRVVAGAAVETAAATDEPATDESATEPVVEPSQRGGMLGGIGTIVSRVAKGRRRDTDLVDDPTQVGGATTDDDATGDSPAADRVPEAAPTAPVPLRETRPALRAEVTRDVPATLGNAALHESPDQGDAGGELREGRELRRPGSVSLVFEPARGDTGRVRPISQLGDPVAPLVIDDFVTEPAYDPVIGPELAAARTRLGLSVDELAERTRIRPHVIESVEVDDFAPCGGDFYARGHLRTLARVLGTDPGPLLERFEERYATAPVNARRVFEAELATGMTGSMRSTMGGPNWGLLVGAVLSLVLVWGVVRLFAGEPAELVQTHQPVLNGSAGVGNAYPAPADVTRPVKPLPVTLVAAHADSQVVVRNGKGRIVFSGELALGEKKRLEVAPPVRVRADDAGAIEVVVRKADKGVLGVLGEPGRRTFR